jgi:hypothetical protein
MNTYERITVNDSLEVDWQGPGWYAPRENYSHGESWTRYSKVGELGEPEPDMMPDYGTPTLAQVADDIC